jgi:hypothetical protein
MWEVVSCRVANGTASAERVFKEEERSMTTHVLHRSTVIILASILLVGLAAIGLAANTAGSVFHAKPAALITAQTASTTTSSTAMQTSTGNGAPSGPHYNLNIHGVQKGGSASTTSNGGDIFVPLYGGCKIALSPGDFQVLDRNCLDGSAGFQLPNPVGTTTTTSVTTTYSVWVRALAKPGGSSSMTTCATDPTTGTIVCSINAYVSVQTRKNGQSVFSNVTADLLFVTYCNTATGKVTQVPLFDPSLQNYFWQYDNNGLKLLQLRFYQLPTTVIAPTSTC